MLKETVERWREELIAKGRQEGLQAGLQAGLREGIQAGRKEGVATTLTRLLEYRFGPLALDRREEIWVADSNTLTQWTRQILTAEHLEEIFDPLDFGGAE